MNDFRYDFVQIGDSIPMIDFLESLNTKEKALIFKHIEKLIEFKNNNFGISTKFSKLLRNGIFELKVELQNRTSRSLYYYEKNQMIVFTNGFINSTVISFNQIGFIFS